MLGDSLVAIFWKYEIRIEKKNIQTEIFKHKTLSISICNSKRKHHQKDFVGQNCRRGKHRHLPKKIRHFYMKDLDFRWRIFRKQFFSDIILPFAFCARSGIFHVWETRKNLTTRSVFKRVKTRLTNSGMALCSLCSRFVVATEYRNVVKEPHSNALVSALYVLLLSSWIL